MASVSAASNSLGNTSLRGYGGFASGIDRDAIIEQMTKATNSKITKQKNSMTSLSWKQEAYQSVSDKILDMYDNYFSYSSGTNLKEASIFAKNQISVLGDSKVTKFVSATGTSKLVNSLSILGVKQTATAATRISGKKVSNSDITADRMTNLSVNDTNACQTSNLKGRRLTFGLYNEASHGYDATQTFEFPSSYKDDAGKEQQIDYTDIYNTDGTVSTAKVEALTDKLNKALKQANLKLGGDTISDVLEFKFDGGKFQINAKTGHEDTSIVINETSSALSALGYQTPNNSGGDPVDTSGGISLKTADNVFNNGSSNFVGSSITKQSMTQYMAGRKIKFSYGGQTKEIELVKEGETFTDLNAMAAAMTSRLEKAFGLGNVTADGSSGTLKFTVSDSKQNLTINCDDPEVRSMMGIENGASNKLSMNASIWENRDKLGFEKAPGVPYGEADKAQFEADLESSGSYIEINHTKIDISADTTISGLLDKINSNKEIGVKASYLNTSNQFVLVADESGNRGEIDLGVSGLGEKLFGYNQSDPANADGGSSKGGQNAQILVSYGNGVSTMVESLSNSFDLEGLRVTVTGEFGDVSGSEGHWSSDSSQAVTFSASADVDGVTEKVKKFIEEYNTLVKEINTQISTKPDKSYGPLTDEQKDEMSETSIENWEKKAKQGLLFNDSTMRDLSMSIQGVITELLGSGASMEDLENMGISASEDYYNGGEIVFDENKFKDAMTNDPEKVADVFTGGGDINKGLSKIIQDTFSPYANRYPTQNGNTYGRLIEEAGSEKLPLTITNNQIYRQLKDMEESIEKLKTQLKSEQDRYISQFTTMETMISQMNSQSSYLSSLQG